MTIADAALTSRSPADSPSYALRLALAERLASHRAARPSMRLAAVGLRDVLPPAEQIEAERAPRSLIAVGS